MVGKRFNSPNPSSISFSFTGPSRVLIASFSLLALASVFFFSSSSSGRIDTHFHSHSASTVPLPRNPNSTPPTPDRSFVASLKKFLASRSSKAYPSPDTVAGEGNDAAVRKLDQATSRRKMDALHIDPPDSWSGLPVLRVFVYEMPAKFTYDLLWLFLNTYNDNTNLTSNGSPVNRLIEQHSIDYWLWIDLISPQSERLLKNVIRVHQEEEADLFYIPFFTTISYFLLEKQQCKALYRDALKWVMDQPAWQRSEGRDHILPVHHPWSFKSVRHFMKKAIWIIPDMDSTGKWYKPGQVCLKKDLILPYVPNVDLCDEQCLRETQSKRSTLLFFRGRLKRNAGGKVRNKLVEVLRNITGVVVEEGSSGIYGKEATQYGMRTSKFCLSPAGDTPSSARLFDAIVSGCIPVIVSDELDLPFEGLLDYQEMAMFVSSMDVVKPGLLVKFLKGIDLMQIKEMQENLAKYLRHFLYSHPAQPLGPENLAWKMIMGKLMSIKQHVSWLRRMVKRSTYILKNTDYVEIDEHEMACEAVATDDEIDEATCDAEGMAIESDDESDGFDEREAIITAFAEEEVFMYIPIR